MSLTTRDARGILNYENVPHRALPRSLPSPRTVNPSAPAVRGAPPLGRHLEASGRRLAFYRSGASGPPVVFLPGAGGMGLDLYNVHALTAAHTTSILYDRGGTGWSAAMDLPRTAAAVTDELRELLRVADVPAPYVLVGHSLGGAYARHYAQRFPSEVAALLLLDPAHEDLPAQMPAQVTEAAQQMKSQRWDEPPRGMVEFFRTLLLQRFSGWPAELREALVACHGEHWRAGFLEASNADDVVYPELASAAPTPDVPLIVLGAMAVDAAMSGFSPEAIQREVNEGKRVVNRRLAASVPRGEYRELADATHAWMHIDRPDAVMQALLDLLAGVGRGRA